MQLLIYQFLLNCFPELVVLQVHASGALHGCQKSLHGLFVQCFDLFFNQRHNNIPEVRRSFEIVLSDEVEAVHDLLRCHFVMAPLCVHIHYVACVLGSHQLEIDLVPISRHHLVPIVVTPLVQRSHWHDYKWLHHPHVSEGK